MLGRYIWNPLKYSLSGLRYALRDRAFRLEIVLGLVFYPLLLIRFHFSLKMLFISVAYFLILVAEVINCAFEKLVDLVSPGKHPLAEQAKDMASGAVMLALGNLAVILLYCFFS
jgi:diacylglycerol kinase